MLIKGFSAIIYFMKTKKITIYVLFLIVSFLTPSCNEGYEDSELIGRVENLENKVQKLEEQMNSNISSLQSIMEVIQNNDYITSVTPVMEDGKEIGYTIFFKKGNPITIYHGQNNHDGQDGKPGEDGQDGYTPQIGVKQDTDGIYYWTLDGEWMTDENGSKIKAQGIDGQDGKPGEDGQDGKDGITPQFKIEDEYWWVSYDDGTTWEKLGQATGGDVISIFKSVTKNDKEVIFTLNDDTTIVIPIVQKVEISFDFEGDEVGFSEGETLYINYTLKNATDDVQVTASSDGNFVTKVEANDKTSGRISIKCINGGTDGYINVIVNDGNGYSYLKVINIYKSKIEFVNGLDYKISAMGGNVMVPISVNFDYEVDVVQGDSWVTVNSTSRAEMRDEVLSFSVAQNSTSAERYAKVQLYNPSNREEVYAEIMIGQSGREFSIEKNRMIFYNNGGTVETMINSTLDIKAEVTPSVSWIDATIVKSEDMTSYKLTVVADAVSSPENRNAEISIYSIDGNILLGKISVVQSGISDEDANAMIVVTRANYSNDFTAYLPLDGDLNCYVDWGDGEIEYFESRVDEGITHKYSTSDPTSFEVRISGKVQALSSNNLPTHTITEVKQWGRLELVSMEEAFMGNSILKSIPNDFFGAFENVYTFERAFYGCRSLISIPNGLFDKCSNAQKFHQTFSGCSSLTSIPGGLFDNCLNAQDFTMAFKDCSSLVSIPNGLFDKCLNATSFISTFGYCSSLTSVPNDLFKSSYETSFSGTFQYCTSLASIPSGLFDNCPNAQSFNSTFHYCSSLTSIPNGLFDKCSDAKNFDDTFLQCTSLTSVPNELFKSSNETSFNGTFGYCRSLTSIPNGLFDNCPNAQSFNSTFYYCSSLASVPNDLFKSSSETSFNGTFLNCTSLTSVPNGLFDNCPNAKSFKSTFEGCTSLTSVPDGLFDYNRRVLEFFSTFKGCSNLKGESPYTVINGVKYHLYDRYKDIEQFVTPNHKDDCFRDCNSLDDYNDIPSDWK